MDELLSILKDKFPAVDFSKEDHLLSGDVLDSVDLVDIVSTIRRHYGVEISVDDIEINNFDSAQAIFSLITRLKNNQ